MRPVARQPGTNGGARRPWRGARHGSDTLAIAILGVAITMSCPRTWAQDVADVFAKVHASVVTIRSAELQVRADPDPEVASAMLIGSGVLLSGEGEILTAAHVVKLADHVDVTFVDGSVLPARVVASESVPDLALLQVLGTPPALATPAHLGDSDTVRVGSRILIIGAPLDMEHTLTVGYVSARRQGESFLGAMKAVEHFQTDAAINKGNSGGPMFSMNGDVIGIVCHIVSESGGSDGLGFAVTSNAVRDLLLTGRHFWLGFDSIPLPPEFGRALNVPDGGTGLLVQKVARGSPAETLGLRGGTIPMHVGGRDLLLGGDVILSILDLPLRSTAEIEAAVRALIALPAEERLRMEVLREGSIVEVSGLRGP